MNNKANKKIKVLYIQEPAGGGSLIALYELLKKLNPREIESAVLCYYRSKYTEQLENIPGCKVIYADDTLKLPVKKHFVSSKNRLLNVVLIQYNALRKYFYYDKKLVNYISTVIEQEKPDILHHNNDIVVNRSSIRAGVGAGVTQILHYRGFSHYRYNVVDYFIDKSLIKKINYHIPITNAIHEYYEKMFHSPLYNSAVIHDFVETGVFKPLPINTAIKKELEIQDKEIVIADIGRIVDWKGHHILIEAMHLIKNELPPFKVLIVGSCEKGVGSKEYYEYLQKLTCQYELQDKIIFTGNRTDIAEIMNTADVVVHTAVKPEPQGMVLIEAMLCKKLVIASDDAGSAELIKKYGGILFEPGNAKQLAEILLKLFKNKNGSGVIETMYPCNYEKLKLDFDVSIKAKQFVEIYKQCVQ